jgi:formiminotetrahydrofolate cyclodeaminase
MENTMNSTDLSCKEFVSLLASDAPAPGGGGAAALIGALGVALGNMVGSLTAGKPKFANVEAEVRELKAAAEALQDQLLALVARDAEVFVPLSQAYGLPKTTDEEAALKDQIMESCLVTCAKVPLQIMHTCGEALELLQRFEQIGTPIAISDVGCGALTLKAALLSADLNVRVNTQLMKNRLVADAINAEAQGVVENYEPLAEKIALTVKARVS